MQTRIENHLGRRVHFLGIGGSSMSGLAGLLSHIKARIQQGQSEQWLLFGERSPEHDALCGYRVALPLQFIFMG